MVNKPTAIYVHWPFCLSKCPYCDFNSHVRDNVDEDAFLNAYLIEIDHYAASDPDMVVGSIFFGGGTPSLMSAKTVGAIIERILHHWKTDGEVEITLEANPTSVEAARFEGYRSAGVNRLSLGVQSLVDDDLKALGRAHSADEALSALSLARSTFDRFSFDLIYARENQTLHQWQDELKKALDLSGGHLSLYQLTIEPGTKFQGLYNKGELVLPEENLAEEMFFLTREMTAKAGLPAYEVSNHASTNNHSKHNMAYWLGHSYLGIGAGAHGRIVEGGTVTATANFKKPEGWLRSIEAQKHGREESQLLSKNERGVERLMMGLRVNEGVLLEELPEEILDQKSVEKLCQDGLIKISDGRLRLDKRGQCLLNYVLASILV